MKKVLLGLFGILFVVNSFANTIAANVTNPVCDNTTLDKYNGTANVEINWEPNTIALRWYDRENQLSVPTESQSCVYDGAMVIPSAPTRTGYTFMGWKVIDVPDGYTKVEYLQSTGTQYIDTNYVPNNNTGVQTKIQFLQYNNPATRFFGSSLLYNNSAFESYESGGHLECNYGSDVFWNTQYTLGLNDIVYIDWNKNILNYKINDENWQTYSFGAQTFTVPYQMRLFTITRPESAVNPPTEIGRIKIYYFKIYENYELVRDFLPVIDPQNVPCMYDKVSGQCFYNAGTGTFIAGPVVQ